MGQRKYVFEVPISYAPFSLEVAMKLLTLVISILLLCGTVAAIGMHAWHGQWTVVVLTLASAFIGKIILGIVDLLLLPISLPALYFARRGNTTISTVITLLFAFLERAAFAAFCAAVLLFYIRVPGPPMWLAVVLSTAVASAPFAWASQRNQDDAHPVHVDALASTVGVAMAGGLFLLGVNPTIALLPIAIAFLVPAIGHVIWWSARGAPKARRAYYIENLT